MDGCANLSDQLFGLGVSDDFAAYALRKAANLTIINNLQPPDSTESDTPRISLTEVQPEVLLDLASPDPNQLEAEFTQTTE